MKTTRIAFKESAIIKPACFRPHMVTLLEHLLAVAPDTVDGIMWITEGWREPRHADDAHTWCNAFDIRSRNLLGEEHRKAKMQRWGEDTRASLGRVRGPYHFEAHGEGSSLHLHAEFDPR